MSRQFLRLLVQYGADSNIKDCSGATALFFALELNNSEIVHFLVEEAGADVNAYNYKVQTPLHIASYYGNMDLVEYLVEKGAEIDAADEDSMTPLLFASQNKNLDVCHTSGLINAIKAWSGFPVGK